MNDITLQELDTAYVAAANALTTYRVENGFVPGARVICQAYGLPVTQGVIADYGLAWATTKHRDVPVVLSTGEIQPWPLTCLTIVEHAAAEMEGQQP